MRPEDMQRYEVDVVWSASINDEAELYLTIECRRCEWIVEAEAPAALPELVQRAEEHTKVCR